MANVEIEDDKKAVAATRAQPSRVEEVIDEEETVQLQTRSAKNDLPTCYDFTSVHMFITLFLSYLFHHCIMILILLLFLIPFLDTHLIPCQVGAAIHSLSIFSLILVSVIFISFLLIYKSLEYSVVHQFTLCIAIYKLLSILSNLQNLA